MITTPPPPTSPDAGQSGKFARRQDDDPDPFSSLIAVEIRYTLVRVKTSGTPELQYLEWRRLEDKLTTLCKIYERTPTP